MGGGEIPRAGIYLVIKEATSRKKIFKKSMDTIGDSITWWSKGRFFRCLMRDNGLLYDFVGSHTDIFGFGHDGEGGNTSAEVLGRLDSIPYADSYFLLIGTNDRITAQKTIDHIVEIAKKLGAKHNSSVYISTLLPRADKYNQRNQEINEMLISYGVICSKCHVIDLGGAFYALPNWQSYLADGLHPSLKGYIVLAKLVAKYINDQNVQDF